MLINLDSASFDLIKALLSGTLFGAALYLVGASNRKNLIEMLKLKDLTLMKIILFGIGLASALIFTSYYMGIMPIEHFNIKSMYWGVIPGAALLGIGFGALGICPGTSLASFGAGYFKAIFFILGGLLGAWVFSLSYALLKSWGVFNEIFGGKTTLFLISDKYPAIFEVGSLGGILVGIFFMILAILLPDKLSQ